MNPAFVRWIYCSEREDKQNIDSANKTFTLIRNNYDNKLKKENATKRKIARKTYVEKIAKVKLDDYLRRANPEKRLDDHFNKISLDERVKKIEDLLRKLDEDIYPKNIARSPEVLSLDTRFITNVKRTLDDVRKSNKKAFLEVYNSKYSLEDFIKKSADLAPPVEDDFWASCEKYTVEELQSVQVYEELMEIQQLQEREKIQSGKP